MLFLGSDVLMQIPVYFRSYLIILDLLIFLLRIFVGNLKENSVEDLFKKERIEMLKHEEMEVKWFRLYIDVTKLLDKL
jgi:hypothetical protein